MFCKACGEKLHHKPLTPREAEILALVTEGHKHVVIAALLGLAEGTVKVYISKMYDKLGCSDKFELLKWHYEGLLKTHVCQTKEV